MPNQPMYMIPADTDNAEQTSCAAPVTTRPRGSRVRTGLGVAALAGVIAVSGGATTSLGSSFNAFANPNDTTCCGSGGTLGVTA
jgi:hypothetical protein